MNRFILIWPVIVFVLNLAAQTTYYVAPYGIDDPTSGDIIQPFMTPQYAIDQVLTPGDTLYLRAGTYTNANYNNGSNWNLDETIKLVNFNSTQAKPTVITNYNDEKVVLKGNGDFIIQVRNCKGVIVSGLEVEGEASLIPLDSALQYQFAYKDSITGPIKYRVPPFSTPAEVMSYNGALPILSSHIRPSKYSTIGVLIQNSDSIDVEKMTIHHCPGTGLRTFKGNYIRLINNEIYECSTKSAVGNHGLVVHSAESDHTNSNKEKFLIEGNEVYHNYNTVYSWSALKDFITPVIDEGKGISMQKNTTTWQEGRIAIRNNMVYENGFSGIHLNDCKNFDIINNTVYNNFLTGHGNNTGISLQGATDCNVFSNVTVSNNNFGGYALSGVSMTNVYVDSNHVQGTIDTDIDAIDQATSFGDPMFVDATNKNFIPQVLSPLIDRAKVSTAPLDDFYGRNRESSDPDIGAVEYEFNCLVADTVNTTADSGPLSLRNLAENLCTGDTIYFDASLANLPILLNSPITIDRQVVIIGLGLTETVVDGQSLTRIFDILPEGYLVLQNMTLKGGFATSAGGAIFNEGVLRLENVLFEDNKELTVPKALTMDRKGRLFVDGNTVEIRE